MKLASLLLVSALVAAPLVQAQEGKNVEDAKLAADQWLARLDAGDLGATWQEAAGAVRTAVPQAAWAGSLRSAVGPLGALTSRRLRSADYTRSLPGAPDGEYVVIVYDSSFKNKEQAVETVTPMRDKDGSWKVSGYYVR